jgi:hypothetical protein
MKFVASERIEVRLRDSEASGIKRLVLPFPGRLFARPWGGAPHPVGLPGMPAECSTACANVAPSGR